MYCTTASNLSGYKMSFVMSSLYWIQTALSFPADGLNGPLYTEWRGIDPGLLIEEDLTMIAVITDRHD